jgi:hypothetical protein
MHNYWLVGASYGGNDPQDKKFVEEGYWLLGWSQNDSDKSGKSQSDKALSIEIGDRIAIKRNMGGTNPNIRILHLGIVKGVVKELDRVICTVDWVVTELDREVEGHGCYKSVNGPYDENSFNGWTKDVFCL